MIEYLKGLYSVYDRMYSLCAVCKPQRFISVYCQFVFLSGACATTAVGRTFRREFTLIEPYQQFPMYHNDLSRFIASTHSSIFANGLSRFIASLFF